MILMQGPPAAGKTLLVNAFVRLAMQNDQPILYVSTESPAAEITSEARKATGTDIAPERFQVLDCYSSATGFPVHGVKVLSPCNLSEVSIEFQSALRKLTRPYVVFDSIDAFALDAGEDTALKFFRTIAARVKERGTSGSATVTVGMHSSRFQTVLRAAFQGIIELKLDESKDRLERYLRIFALKGAVHTTDWYPFRITEDGILIGSDEYRQTLPLRHMELHFLRFVH